MTARSLRRRFAAHMARKKIITAQHRRPTAVTDPRVVLGVADHATDAQVVAAYLKLASRALPTAGANAQAIARLRKARDELLGDGL
jgi:hypothetical protein